MKADTPLGAAIVVIFATVDGELQVLLVHRTAAPEEGRWALPGGRWDGNESLDEAAEHLIFSNSKAPDHLATYHILGQVLIKLRRNEEARSVLKAGCEKVSLVGEGMGRDLGPAMAELLRPL